MKRWLIIALLIVLMVIVFVRITHADSWIKVACHVKHTLYSDGTGTFAAGVAEAKFWHFDVYIANDHLEQIAKIPNGFEKYLADCAKKYSGITVIPGVEVEVNDAHTVVFGHLTVKAMKELNTTKQIADIVHVANKYGLITVAAHPFDSFNPYDRANAFGVTCHEFFNDKGVGYGKNIVWLFEKQAEGQLNALTAGMDSHTTADPNDNERWQRATYVYAKSTSVDDILNAFRAHKTYARCLEWKLENLNIIPSVTVIKTKPHLTFTVKCAVAVAVSNHRIRIYRDEKLVDTQWLFPGQTTKTVDFVDKDCPSGIHRYNIEVEQGLITSAILLDVPKPPVISEPIISTGSIPILLGKTRAEIEQLFGVPKFPNGLISGVGRNHYYYRYVYDKKYRRSVNFWLKKDGGPYGSGIPQNQVHSVLLRSTSRLITNELRASQIVPVEILSRKPSGVYRGVLKNSVIVVWYIGQNTYFLALHADENVPLYTTVRVPGGKTKYYANKNTGNFQTSYVYGFVYADWIEKPIKSTNMYTLETSYGLHFDSTDASEWGYYPFDK